MTTPYQRVEPGAAPISPVQPFDTGWHRLHPLSPAVRAGRRLVVLPFLLLFLAIHANGGNDEYAAYRELGVVVVAALAGLISWLVTRWRIDQDSLLIEAGLIRRQSRRFPLSRLQAVDIVRPGLARAMGLAELRLRLAGTEDTAGRLAYLTVTQAEELRGRLLAVAHGLPPTTAPPPEQVLLRVPASRLLAATALIALPKALVVGAGLAVLLVVGGRAAASFAVLLAIVELGILVRAWRRFSGAYGLEVAEAPDGLRLRSGLIETNAETIPRGRVQAVRLSQPLLWRPLGWCRVEADLAGRQRARGESGTVSHQLREVLPAGPTAQGLALVSRIVPDPPAPGSPPPGRARWKAPLRYHFLSWSSNERYACSTDGRVCRRTEWVPLGKAQSVRLVQGPWQRWMNLASVHIDTAGRSIHTVALNRDAQEAGRLLQELVASAAQARTG